MKVTISVPEVFSICSIDVAASWDEVLMYIPTCVEVEFIALVTLELDPAAIRNPPFTLKLPLKSIASSGWFVGPLTMVVPPVIVMFPLLSMASLPVTILIPPVM